MKIFKWIIQLYNFRRVATLQYNSEVLNLHELHVLHSEDPLAAVGDNRDLPRLNSLAEMEACIFLGVESHGTGLGLQPVGDILTDEGIIL